MIIFDHSAIQCTNVRVYYEHRTICTLYGMHIAYAIIYDDLIVGEMVNLNASQHA